MGERKGGGKRDASAAPRYDFFVSYRHGGPDEAFARDILQQLEAKGYKGAIDKRDFPGNDILPAQMAQFIRDSRHTLAIISQRYLDSGFCEEEAALCKTLDMKERKKRLTLLFIEDVEVHAWLQTIPGVYFTDGNPVATSFAKLVKTLGKPLGSAKPPSEAKRHNLPPRNPFFTGREKILEDIHKDLEETGTAGLTQVHGISGLGGLGKSQTALEYAYRHLGADYDVALWMRADTENELRTGFLEAARLLGLAGEGPQPDEAVLAAVKAWLESHSRWLLVLDNVEGDRQDLVKPYLPHGQGGRVLMTSRAAQLDALSVPKPIALDAMEPDEARNFLYERTQRKEGAEEEAVRAIAETLGYFPLALEQAAAYIVTMGCTFAAYGKSFENRRKAFLAHKPEAGDYPDTVATTWSMNFEEVGKTAKASADLLRFAAFLDPDRIPFELLCEGGPELGPRLAKAFASADEDPLVVNEVLEPLRRYSLIRVDQADESVSIHRLVQQAVRDRLNAKDEGKWAERTVRAVNAAVPKVEFETWPLCDRLLPHAYAAIALIEKHGLVTDYAGRLLSETACFLHDRARYADAAPLYLRAIATREKALGPEHPGLAASLNNLAVLYRTQGRYAEAEPLYQSAIDAYEKALGPEHPNLAASLNNFANLYYAQGRYAEAEPLYQRAIEITEKALGPEHPDLAISLNNLAALYQAQGRYADAEPLYQRDIEITEKALGPEHPELATSLNNLAGLHRAQGRYADAEPLHQRDIEITEKALGPEHPDLAISLNNLAIFYEEQGRFDEVEPLYERALAIRLKSLPPDHPALAKVYADYADFLRKLDRDAEAEEYEARSAAIMKQRGE